MFTQNFRTLFRLSWYRTILHKIFQFSIFNLVTLKTFDTVMPMRKMPVVLREEVFWPFPLEQISKVLICCYIQTSSSHKWFAETFF